jgi:error-prone DNA polymerase
MEALFADLPEAIASTAELSSRLDFTMANLGYEFPRYPVPAGENMNSFLRQRAQEGLHERYLPKQDANLLERARRQIERELTLIEQLDLAGYFLIVWDIVQFCRRHGILVQGRGSAANSAVCYALRITAVDPVGMELLFERFLSEERGEWPDIDLDLPSGDQRERAIQHVYQRYGQLGAAMTANVITYRGRSAAREAGKVLGFDAETLDRLSSLVSAWEWRDPTDSLAHQFRHAGFEMQHARIRKYLELCQRLQDLPRHLGQHSGGMVICQGQLDSVVPLEPASMPGRVVVQWDKEDCADLGIIKVDLLGLGMMAVLEDCEKLVPEHYGEPLDLAQLPPDDPAVYQALQRADTVGMFQVESRAQMSSLPRNSPAKFYDLVVQVAIIRPGPIVGKMMHPYMRRRQGREPVCYPHPSLEPVLQRTLGVPLFQEQLLRIAMIAANFTGGEAEELRRAMGFKRSAERMREIETKLRRGMQQNGIAPAAQEEIITQITSFALYGFPESHAASFALIAYASAYLKCHYLAAFTAALLNNQPMGFYSTATIVKDAQRHGLKIAPVNVLCSDWRCTLEPGFSKTDPLSLRLGLCYVRGLREEAARAITRERARSAFRNIDDLARRVPELRKPELVTLAEIGALNALGEKTHRRTALWQVERAGRPVGPLLKELDGETESPLVAMSHEERLVADFSGTGLTVGPHPLRYVRPQLDAMQVRRACDLHNFRDGENVRIAGCVIARQRPGTARGFIFLSLEDETGIANVIIQPDVYEQNRMVVVREKFLLVEGRLQNQDHVISVKARRVAPLVVTQAATQSHDFH